MIKGKCFTMVDEGVTKQWPRVFAVVPRIGDYVRSENGYELRVCRVTHYSYTELTYARNSVPMIEIELTK